MAKLKQAISNQKLKHDAEMASCSQYMMNMQQEFSSALGKDRADQERMRLLLSECQFENNAQQAEFQHVIIQLEGR